MEGSCDSCLWKVAVVAVEGRCDSCLWKVAVAVVCFSQLWQLFVKYSCGSCLWYVAVVAPYGEYNCSCGLFVTGSC